MVHRLSPASKPGLAIAFCARALGTGARRQKNNPPAMAKPRFPMAHSRVGISFRTPHSALLTSRAKAAVVLAVAFGEG